MKRLSSIFIFSVLILLLNSCHTSLFQNVDKQINGVWDLLPGDDKWSCKWYFDEGRLRITVEGYDVLFADGSNFLEYTVVNKMTYHWLYIVYKRDINNYGKVYVPGNQKRYMIVRLKKEKELYLSSESFPQENKQRGHRSWDQYDFIYSGSLE